jgi:hypothetical protein
MKSLVSGSLAVASVVVLLTLAPAGALAEETGGGQLYTTQNLWFEQANSLWCINYKTGTIIPAGTAVKDVAVVKAETGAMAGGQRVAIGFTTVEGGQRYLVNFAPKFHPGKAIEDYQTLLFSSRTLTELTAGMSEQEVEAIRAGKVVEGMSKQAVLVSYGIPPEHKTTSPDANRWMYWTTRFVSKEICFDNAGLAVACAALATPGEL